MPQIELMMADLPHTLYKSKGDTPKQSEVDEAARLTLEAAERKRKAREQKEREMTVEELFNEKETDKHK